ncbi:MAG TPA: CoA-transferase subunit beta, partial [Dongiaceae bacterium]
RAELGMATRGPTLLITDLALWQADPETREFTVTSLHPGVTRDRVQETCGWPVRFAARVEETPPPTSVELETLRDLHARTKAVHAGEARP